MQPPPSGRTLRRRSPRATSTPEAMIRSATGAFGPDLPQQPLGGLFDELEGVLEPPGTAEIGIGNLGCGSRREIEEASHDGVFSAQRRHRAVVRLVHGQNIVEPPAIFGAKQAGPLGRDVYAAGEQALLRPGVWLLSGGVEAVGAGGIDR